MRSTFLQVRARRAGATLAALALIACAWLPGTASAQGVLMGSADLDGDSVADFLIRIEGKHVLTEADFFL